MEAADQRRRQPRELYDIVADPKETANLADKEQATANKLAAQALEWEKLAPWPLRRLQPVPNHRGRDILLIMSDDMGFFLPWLLRQRDSTPNLDALAKDGLRFTQFYNMARCCQCGPAC